MISSSTYFQTQMKNQEEKLRKVKQILRVDSSLSSHAAVHPTRSVATPCQFPVVSETSNVNSCMFSPQRSEQVCRNTQLNFLFINNI
jgi:hypothetical protein